MQSNIDICADIFTAIRPVAEFYGHKFDEMSILETESSIMKNDYTPDSLHVIQRFMTVDAYLELCQFIDVRRSCREQIREGLIETYGSRKMAKYIIKCNIEGVWTVDYSIIKNYLFPACEEDTISSIDDMPSNIENYEKVDICIERAEFIENNGVTPSNFTESPQPLDFLNESALKSISRNSSHISISEYLDSLPRYESSDSLCIEE